MSRDRDINEEEELEISEREMEAGLDKMENWRKCSQYSIPCNGHEGPTGTKCVQEPLETEAQIMEYHKELKETLKGKKRKNKTPGKDPRPPGASQAPDVNGDAQSGSIAPASVS